MFAVRICKGWFVVFPHLQTKIRLRSFPAECKPLRRGSCTIGDHQGLRIRKNETSFLHLQNDNASDIVRHDGKRIWCKLLFNPGNMPDVAFPRSNDLAVDSRA